MADKTLTERLQPSLLDRLTDDEPGNVKESRDGRVIDMRRLREIIQRDLSWLLNTTNAESMIDTAKHPHVVNSVVNYGVGEVAGDYTTVDRVRTIQRMIHRAIATFEPRIKKGSLQVSLSADKNSSQTVITYDIHADMWAQPMPLELYLRSEVDITTGELKLERRA